MPDESDVLSGLDPILRNADTSQSPWDNGVYRPRMDVARQLLAIPISQGMAEEQQTGRVARALDAWIAYELRRSGFPRNAVWPRDKRPRVLPGDIAPIEELVDEALARLSEFEDRLARYAESVAARGVGRPPPSLYRVRPAINAITRDLPGAANAEVLGRFYVKQVDVVVSTWQRGPDLLASTKTQFSSYLNNRNNRYEEAVGEATNLRDRYPMAAMGFAFLVRSNIYSEEGAFAYLRNQLARLRKPDGPLDASMLLVASWDDQTQTLEDLEDPALDQATAMDQSPILSAPRFFQDLVYAVMESTPVDVHQEIRLRRHGKPIGGLPPLDADAAPEEAVGG
jgi:hypothetical protein